MQNTRFLSRFGGLIFFILALMVVGLLVFLTVKSARDNDQVTDKGGTSVSSTDTSKSPNTNESTNNIAENSPNIADTNNNTTGEVFSDQTLNGTSANQVESQEDNSVALSDNANDLPGTGPETDALAFVAVVVLSYFFVNYLNSKRDLRSKLMSGNNTLHHQ